MTGPRRIHPAVATWPAELTQRLDVLMAHAAQLQDGTARLLGQADELRRTLRQQVEETARLRRNLFDFPLSPDSPDSPDIPDTPDTPDTPARPDS